jgi:predicted glycogen debranching enzyme
MAVVPPATVPAPTISFGHQLCADLEFAEQREWLVTNGCGSYASGTVAGLLTRGYHGLMVAATTPPVGRMLMLAKWDEEISYLGQTFNLCTNRWRGGGLSPIGHYGIERFWLEGTVPVWRFGLADAVVEKRLWMEPGVDTTYIEYTVVHASQPLTMLCRAIADYRSYHDRTSAGRFPNAQVTPVASGLKVQLAPDGKALYLTTTGAQATAANDWYIGFDLAQERQRGLQDFEDHLHVGDFTVTLTPGQTHLMAASLEATAQPDLAALDRRKAYEAGLLKTWGGTRADAGQGAPAWVRQAVLAADQFVVNRNIIDSPAPGQVTPGKSVIAGYHWFEDWGRDTMISLPGLALATGRPAIARQILLTFAPYVSQGMLPNRFPDFADAPMYNTVDATLWYFQAIWAYFQKTRDLDTIGQLYPVLSDIVAWHQQGTRFNIHVDPADGLLYAGQDGVQLTWMDAIVGTWVVTPRIGKPIEVNALWYNALNILAALARALNKDASGPAALAAAALKGFGRFWNPATGYCFDVLDGPNGAETHLRPNQLIAISLPDAALKVPDLFPPAQQKAVLTACEIDLLTFPGMRSLSPNDPDYRGAYTGDQGQRDSAYHQGTVWAWLKGPFIEAHFKVYGDADRAQQLLQPWADALVSAGLGSVSEIFEGQPPIQPRGCIAQAWSVGELLRIWTLIN